MASAEGSSKFYQVELRKLETLLRKQLGDDLEIIDYTTESLLPPGENYGSSMLKVHALIRRCENEDTEDLDLVAKMLPPTDFQRLMFDSPYTFRKEAFLYEELIPSYQRLEREFGTEANDVFDIVPKFFGARYSLKDDECFDEDAVILMQNLKVLGYYTGNRQEGLDLEHAKVAIVALARFHALGMAVKKHKPEYFDYLKEHAKCCQMPNNKGFEETAKMFARIMKEDPEIGIYSDFIDDSMSKQVTDSKHWSTAPAEPWPTIVHSDFWVNNIMFHRSRKTNLVDAVKFVDFQNYLVLSPLRELTFFLMISMNVDVMKNGFDELLDTYYDEFIQVLTRMKVDVTPFARDKFDERLKIDAYEEFPHCPFLLNIMTMEVKADEKFDNAGKFMQADSISQKFRERMRMCVLKYAEKGWINKPN